MRSSLLCAFNIFWNLTNLVVMSSSEEYKNLPITTLTSEYLQGILQFSNRISYESFTKHDSHGCDNN